MKNPCVQCLWWLENGDGSQRLCQTCSFPSVSGEDGVGASTLRTSSTSTLTAAVPYQDDEYMAFPDDDDADEDDTKALSWREVPVCNVESSANLNKSVRCIICSKRMRSDNLKRHMETHKDIISMTDDEARDELRARHTAQMQREERWQKIEEIAHKEGIPIDRCKEIIEAPVFDEENLRVELLKNNQLYLGKIELGKKITAIIDEGIIQEESLTKGHKFALDLYRKQRPRFDITSVHLRPWQKQALQLIDEPSERQVIWITGRQGNEGKSWFQCYTESYFGFNRVARIDLRIKHANVCNVLKKRSLGPIDIFLFDDARSVSGEEHNLYRILEDIKDGQATSSKYDNDNIRFKTPNNVMIFSNRYPQTRNLSRDRWVIYNANQDGLNNVTLQIMKMRKDGYNVQNNDHLKKYKL